MKGSLLTHHLGLRTQSVSLLGMFDGMAALCLRDSFAQGTFSRPHSTARMRLNVSGLLVMVVNGCAVSPGSQRSQIVSSIPSVCLN